MPALRLAIVCADEPIASMLRRAAGLHDLQAVVSKNYGEIAELLFESDDAANPLPKLSLIAFDLRASVVAPDCSRRLHMLDSLLRDHTFAGGRWPMPIVIIEAVQFDPGWLKNFPAFASIIQQPEDFAPVVLSDWDDGSWTGVLNRAVTAVVGRESVAALPFGLAN